MARKKKGPDRERMAKLLEEIRGKKATREVGYRERALALFPNVCGRCGKEFSGAKLRELTVHHKDHNHDNNPPDGSNWELLCVYCHDVEHQHGEKDGAYRGGTSWERHSEEEVKHNPFAGLADMVSPNDDEKESNQEGTD
ncbi:MAG: hypothetical protein COA73_11005 [Candidatus Hydrogenedentota bacterium]|nr:MAG: hypothetical protein COA73_11005 [Candidatus Hydrogenedentota bacterium]